MLIVGESGPELDLLQKAVGEDLGAQIGAILLEIDRHRNFAMIVALVVVIVILAFVVAFLALLALVAMGMFGARPRRNAVAAVEIAYRGAQAAAIVDQRETGAEGIGLGRAVGRYAAQIGEFLRLLGLFEMAFLELFRGDRELLGAKQRREDIAADLDILGLAIAAIDMDDELVAQRDIGRGAAAGAVIGRRIGADGVEMVAVLGHRAGDAPVERVDRAADRGAS